MPLLDETQLEGDWLQARHSSLWILLPTVAVMAGMCCEVCLPRTRIRHWVLQAYWPFHKAVCQRNEFADATESSEPKFARWMRAHRSTVYQEAACLS